MSEIITVKYKGYTIQFLEYSEVWEVKIGEDAYSNESLKNVKEHIDRLNKKDFKRFKVISTRWSEIEVVTVTSVDDKGYYWVIDKTGNRKKVSPECVCVYNDKNLDIVKQGAECEKQINRLNEKISKLKEQLEKCQK